VKGAVANATAGGTSTTELRTIYYYDSDGTGDSPSYTGSDWPYVLKRSEDTYNVLGGLNL